MVLLSAFVGLLVVELILHKFSPRHYPVDIDTYEYDDELAFRLRADAHLFKTTDFQHESRVNRIGTSNFQDGFDGYESLVFAIGDSYTQGTGVPADMSYPSQLSLILNQDARGFYAKSFGVVNLGVAGYGGEQELISLRRYASRLGTPSVILYLGCDNDFEDDLMFRSGERHKVVMAGSPVWGRMTTPMRLLLEHSEIAFRLRAAQLERKRSRASQEVLTRLGKASSVAELELPVLEKIKAFAAEHGSLLVVSWSDGGNSYDWLQSWAAQNGIPFADWVPKVNSVKTAVPALPPHNQHSGNHHRSWVNRVMAEEFARQIRTQKR